MKHEHNAGMLVRIAPRPTFDAILVTASRLAIVVAGLVAAVAAAYFARTVLAPVTLAIVLGLMFGPLADRIEKTGIPPWASAAAIVLFFIGALLLAGTSIAVPLSVWIDRLPEIWKQLRSELAEWNGLINTLANVQDNLRAAIGDNPDMTVAVDDGSPVRHVAWLAPAIIAQALLFFASFYFYVATRHQVRHSVLSLCFNRRLRWRIAHVFRDVEHLVSQYLFSITAINAGLGLAVGIVMWAAGIPSPVLWGILAFILNYAIYIGPAVMATLLLGAGLATSEGAGILLPPAIYLLLNLIEAQFVTPTVIGRAVTINPFIIFLALAFWLWLWGPVGGFVAAPLSLICLALIRNILPIAGR